MRGLAAAVLTLAGVMFPTGVASATHRAQVYAIGDSVMIDAKQSLRADIKGIHVNAAVSRQVEDGIALLRSQRHDHRIAATTIFGLGTNGTFTRAELDSVIRLTRGHKLVVITTHCPRCDWTNANNITVRHGCTHARHCWIARFQKYANRHPEWFGDDGVHMPVDGVGARHYAQITAAAWRRATTS